MLFKLYERDNKKKKDHMYDVAKDRNKSPLQKLRDKQQMVLNSRTKPILPSNQELFNLVFNKLAGRVPEEEELTQQDTKPDFDSTSESPKKEVIINSLGEALIKKVENKRLELLMRRYPTCYD